MDIFEKFFHIWNLWCPMHLSINVWSWSGKKSISWYSLLPRPCLKQFPSTSVHLRKCCEWREDDQLLRQQLVQIVHKISVLHPEQEIRTNKSIIPHIGLWIMWTKTPMTQDSIRLNYHGFLSQLFHFQKSCFHLLNWDPETFRSVFVRPYLNCLSSGSDELVNIVKNDFLVDWDGQDYNFSVPVSELDVTSLQVCRDQV